MAETLIPTEDIALEQLRLDLARIERELGGFRHSDCGAKPTQPQITVSGEGSTATVSVQVSDDGSNWRDATWLTRAEGWP